MTRWRLILTLGTMLAIGGVVSAVGVDVAAQSEVVSSDDPRVERGRYLMHDVAMCVQCHSFRSEDGTLSPDKLLHGGTIPIDGPDRMKSWAYVAPDLVTLARGRPDWVIQVLTTGRRPDGTNPLPPMPPFRLTEDDARAIVAYLNTLR